jgi:tetratricopeptide (TPR) repeat protein
MAIKLREKFWLNYNTYGIFKLKRGELNDAARLFKKALDINPRSQAAWTNLAATQILLGNMSDAELMLKSAIDIQPSTQTHSHLGYVLFALGRYSESAKEYEKAVHLGRTSPDVFLSLGDAYRHAGDISQSKTAYNRCTDLGEARLRLNPNDDESRAVLSLCYAGNNNCRAAVSLSNQYKRTTTTPYIHYYLGVSDFLCGRRERAVEHISTAIKNGIVADFQVNPDLKPLLLDPRISVLLDKSTHAQE